MNNKFLKYLMKNNADETISKKGIEIRKKTKPAFYSLLKIMNPLKLEIESDLYTPTEEPVIYIASHGFKDDALNTLLTIKDNSYLVAGNIDLFFNTLDGTCLWINGVILVDRFDKESKHAAKDKMKKVLKLGNSVVIFPEGTWCLSENKLAENLYYGFYEVAEETGAKVVPITTQFVGDKCYAKKGEAYDITKLGFDDSVEVMKRIRNNVQKARDLIIYKDSFSTYASLTLDRINLLISSLSLNPYLKNLSDLEIENIIKEMQSLTSNALDKLKKKYNEISKEDNEILVDIFKRVFILLNSASNSKKIVAVEKMRDKIFTSKYEILEKHSNFSDIPRSELDKNGSLKREWEIYRQSIINGTPYFYYEPEQSVVFQNPLVSTEEEVFSGISKKLK